MLAYYRLLDFEHRGTIVRADDMQQYQYVPGKGWVRSGIMLGYFWPESDRYDLYEEISEDEALRQIQTYA